MVSWVKKAERTSRTLNQRNKWVNKVGWEVFDIEDLHKLGSEMQLWPYYFQKFRISEADVIFMPYNYLLDSKLRSTFHIKFEDWIIIFDEAHNIEKVCEDISSFEISMAQLDDVIYELKHIAKKTAVKSETQLFRSDSSQITEIIQFTTNFKENFKNFDPRVTKEHRTLTSISLYH